MKVENLPSSFSSILILEAWESAPAEKSGSENAVNWPKGGKNLAKHE